MADFFEQKPEEPTVPEKVRVGEKEYDQSELSSLVGLGEMTREIETKWNTKIDRIWPEYTKTTQKVKDLQRENEELKKPQVQVPQEFDENTAKTARDQAKKLGLVTNEDLPQTIEPAFKQFYQRERAAEKLLDEASALEEEFSGADGRPKFDKEAVFNHMIQEGYKSPRKAYKDLYEDQLKAWEETQLNKAKGAPFYTTKTSSVGNKQPVEVRPNKDNLGELMREALGQGNW